ncbi:MAG: hypothetical protein ACWA47_07410, partial [Brevirhabdus sp.]
MKTILTAAVIATLSAGFASAMIAPDHMTHGVQSQIDRYVDGVDVNTLTNAQLAALHLILSGEDKEGE